MRSVWAYPKGSAGEVRISSGELGQHRSGRLARVLPRASTFLPANFDSSTLSPRVVLLVSPTCPLCRAGVDLVLEGLDAPGGHSFDVHVVWLPVLEEDDADAAADAADSIGRRRRVTHYWDDDRSISSAARAVLDLGARRRRVAWDIYLFYRPGAGWDEPLPVPDLWLHQLDISDQPSLDDRTLIGALREMSSSDRTGLGALMDS